MPNFRHKEVFLCLLAVLWLWALIPFFSFSRLVQIVAELVVRLPSPPSMGYHVSYIYISFHKLSIKLQAVCSFYMAPIGHSIRTVWHAFLYIFKSSEIAANSGVVRKLLAPTVFLKPGQNDVILFPISHLFLWLSFPLRILIPGSYPWQSIRKNGLR